MSVKLIIFLILGVIIAAIGAEAFLRRNRGVRPLSQSQPKRAEDGKKPLGLEATDMDVLEKARRQNELIGQRNDVISFGSLRLRPKTKAKKKSTP